MKNNLPNMLTLANLFSGFIGVLCAMNGDLPLAGIMIFVGAIFDVFDGMAARALKVSSPIGKELDSLADVVTFGFLPAIIAHGLLMKSHADWLNGFFIGDVPVASLIVFLILGAAAWRLARFNVVTSSDKYFSGMPSPANGMFFASLPLIADNDSLFLDADVLHLSGYVLNPYLLVGFVLLFSWLMVSNVRLFTLKFSSLAWRDNQIIYSFLLVSVALFAVLLWAAIPVILFLYVILSLFKRPKPDEI